MFQYANMAPGHMSKHTLYIVFARDAINRLGPLLPRFRILRYKKSIPQYLKRFWDLESELSKLHSLLARAASN